MAFYVWSGQQPRVVVAVCGDKLGPSWREQRRPKTEACAAAPLTYCACLLVLRELWHGGDEDLGLPHRLIPQR